MLRYTRFLSGGMQAPQAVQGLPAYVFEPDEEWRLEQALQWQRDMKSGPDRFLPFREAEPERWRQDDITWEWENTMPNDDQWNLHYGEWEARRDFASLNIRYGDWNDRFDRGTDLGYIYSTHHYCGLDVVLSIPRIDFFRDRRIWGSRDELAPFALGLETTSGHGSSHQVVVNLNIGSHAHHP